MDVPVNPSSIEHDFFLDQWTKTLRMVYGVIPDADRGAAMKAAWHLLQLTIREALPDAQSEIWIKSLSVVIASVFDTQKKPSEAA